MDGGDLDEPFVDHMQENAWEVDGMEEDDSDTWTTRDGRTLFIRDMEDSHLLNTLRFVQRRVFETWDGILDALMEESDPMFSAVSLALEQYRRQMADGGPASFLDSFPKYQSMICEGDRRDLDVEEFWDSGNYSAPAPFTAWWDE